jgi:hypothetical protein
MYQKGEGRRESGGEPYNLFVNNPELESSHSSKTNKKKKQDLVAEEGMVAKTPGQELNAEEGVVDKTPGQDLIAEVGIVAKKPGRTPGSRKLGGKPGSCISAAATDFSLG